MSDNEAADRPATRLEYRGARVSAYEQGFSDGEGWGRRDERQRTVGEIRDGLAAKGWLMTEVRTILDDVAGREARCPWITSANHLSLRCALPEHHAEPHRPIRDPNMKQLSVLETSGDTPHPRASGQGDGPAVAPYTRPEYEPPEARARRLITCPHCNEQLSVAARLTREPDKEWSDD